MLGHICSLLLIFAVSTVAQTNNHIQNGTFDRSLAKWDLWGANYDLKRQRVYVQNDTAKWTGLSQNIIIPQKAHSVKIEGSMVNVAVATTSESWESAQIAIEFLDGCGSTLLPYPPKVASRNATRDWKRFSKKYQINTEASQIKVLCALGNVTGRAWFDSLSVTFYDKYKHPIPYDSSLSVNLSEDLGVPTAGEQIATVTKSGQKYVVYLPKEYDTTKTWPLVLFLHGSGERGDCISKVLNHTPIHERIAAGKQFPFVILSPLCPAEEQWEDSLIEQVYQDALNRFKIDTNRVAVTGLSLGGLGTIQTVLAHPTRFKAAVPIAGWYEGPEGEKPDSLCATSEVSWWFFHGAQDDVVAPSKSQVLVKALKKCDGTPKFTIYEEEGHVGAFKRAYNDDALYDWIEEKIASQKDSAISQ